MMLTGLNTCKTKRAPFPLDSHDGALACAIQNGTIVGRGCFLHANENCKKSHLCSLGIISHTQLDSSRLHTLVIH